MKVTETLEPVSNVPFSYKFTNNPLLKDVNMSKNSKSNSISGSNDLVNSFMPYITLSNSNADTKACKDKVL